jgi:ABC-type Mn2+/Zn2+ transport system ATPase subunit
MGVIESFFQLIEETNVSLNTVFTIAIEGVNGVGKSTLLNLLLKLTEKSPAEYVNLNQVENHDHLWACIREYLQRKESQQAASAGKGALVGKEKVNIEATIVFTKTVCI